MKNEQKELFPVIFLYILIAVFLFTDWKIGNSFETRLEESYSQGYEEGYDDGCYYGSIR